MNQNPRLHFFGASGFVAGSCMLIETGATTQVLIDCGLFQGSKTLQALNYQKFPFEPRALSALLLTHAHIDHSGLIPKLALMGFRGPIYATQPTIELCRAMLPDSGAIQEMDVESLNQRNRRRGLPEVKPIYTKVDARACLELFKPCAFKTWLDVAPGVRARWWNAGHILGSASIEVEVGIGDTPQRLLFSGDIGPGGSAFIADPEAPSGIDHLVLESTYGDARRKVHSPQERKQELANEVSAARTLGGPLLIPAFAVERTQELIADLVDLMASNQAPPGPIFLDSPLAIEVTQAFLRYGGDGGANRFANLRESDQLHFTESAEESRSIERVHGWHIIIAASGMCDAGRVRHHLKRLLWRDQATVLLVGYQAQGTLGRFLQDGRKEVRLQGEDIRVQASIRSITAYSGHADAAGLLAWAQARAPIKGSIFLTHGEPNSAQSLQAQLEKAEVAGGRVIAPKLDDFYVLGPSAEVANGETGVRRLAGDAAARFDWHNARANFLAHFEDSLRTAASDAQREELVSGLERQLRAAPTRSSAS